MGNNCNIYFYQYFMDLKATVNTNKDLPSALFFSTCLSPQSDLHTMQVFVYDSLQLEQKDYLRKHLNMP